MYEFTESDFAASVSTMMFLMKDSLPWEMLRYCVLDLSYGGRVSETEDLKTLHALSDEILSSSILDPKFQLADSVSLPMRIDSL